MPAGRFHWLWQVAFALALSAAGAEAQSAPPDGEGFTPTVFDIIRADETGNQVIVGSAEPGAAIELLFGADPIATAEANARGEWVLAIGNDLGPGEHVLAIRTTTSDGRFQFVSDERVVVTVAEADVPPRPDGNPPLAGDDGPLAPDIEPQQPELPQLEPGGIAVGVASSMGSGQRVQLLLEGPRVVTVQAGDTLWDIAEQIYGEGALFPLIVTANPTVGDPRRLQPGQALLVPDRPN